MKNDFKNDSFLKEVKIDNKYPSMLMTTLFDDSLVETEVHHVPDQDIRGLLMRDFISRKSRQWNLLHGDQFAALWEKNKILRHGIYPNPFTPDNNRNRYYSQSKILDCSYLAANKGNIISFSSETFETSFLWEDVERLAIENLDSDFPHITALLLAFKGQIVLCGGAVYKAIYCDTASDADIFFIDPKAEIDFRQTKYDDLLSAVKYTLGLSSKRIRPK